MSLIGSVRGRVLYAGPDVAIVEAGGVGYRVSLPVSTRVAMPAQGQEVFLWVYTHVREDTLALYGFATLDELELFRELLQVSGMGPRLALAVLSTFSPAEFRNVVASGDVAALTRVPGVGKKIAQRLLFEMKGKIDASAAEALPGSEGASAAWSDALEALVSLGYARHEALAALRAAGEDLGAEAEAAQLVRRALRELGSPAGEG